MKTPLQARTSGLVTALRRTLSFLSPPSLLVLVASSFLILPDASLADVPKVTAALPAIGAVPGEPFQATLEVDGLVRDYVLYLPKTIRPGAPLVLVIHGFTDNALNMMRSSRMNQLAEANGFAVCYPQGTRDKQGRSFWEVGYDFTVEYHRNDVSFLVALAKHLQANYGLSETNTFASGMSNGAEMSLVLGLFAPHTFHAVAAVSGCIMQKTRDAIPSIPSVPAFFISGDKDDITWWQGDPENKGGWGPYLPVLEMVNTFVKDDSGLVKTVEDLPDLNHDDHSTVTATRWFNASTGRRVHFYHVHGGAHEWPGGAGVKDIDASDEIWKFFSGCVK